MVFWLSLNCSIGLNKLSPILGSIWMIEWNGKIQLNCLSALAALISLIKSTHKCQKHGTGHWYLDWRQLSVSSQANVLKQITLVIGIKVALQRSNFLHRPMGNMESSWCWSLSNLVCIANYEGCLKLQSNIMLPVLFQFYAKIELIAGDVVFLYKYF